MLHDDNEIVDKTDTKILEILLKNARTKLKQIAKACGISSSSVLNRIEKLKKNKIIMGTGMTLKRGTLGFPYEASIGIDAETQKIESAAQAIRKQPNVIVCTKSIGRYNLLCLVVAESADKLDEVTQKIKNIPGVKRIGINIWIDEPYCRYNVHNTQPTADNNKLDSTDLEIITELLKDARTPFSKIADRLAISHETVRKKYAKMIKNGTIKGCSIIVDFAKLGYQGTLFIYISQGKGNNRSDTVNDLKKIPELFIITRVMGTYDILALAMAKSLKETARLVSEIQQIPTVEQVDISYATFTYFSFIPKPRTPFQCDTLELS
jgi:Lrp/AsnC family transcriptional regulator for asnA, asnC and gidA